MAYNLSSWLKCASCQMSVSDRIPSPVLGLCTGCGKRVEVEALSRGNSLRNTPGTSNAYNMWSMILSGTKIWHWRGRWRASHMDQPRATTGTTA